MAPYCASPLYLFYTDKGVIFVLMSMNIGIQGTGVYMRNLRALMSGRYRIIVNRGGTRSSKTHSLLQMWEMIASTNRGLKILITRFELPDLKNSALADFIDYIDNTDRNTGFQIGDKYDNLKSVGYMNSTPIADYWNYNKTENVFTHKLTGSQIHFKACKNEQKVKGVKWDYVQFTEGDEIPFSVFRQIIMRLKYTLVIDFNPSNETTWIKTQVEDSRDDFLLIQSSYLDNPFLTPDIVKEIELLKSQDENYWNIYGKGEYGVFKDKIFNFDTCSFEEFLATEGHNFGGLDFGWRNQSCFMHCKLVNENTIMMHEVFHKSFLESKDKNRLLDEYGHFQRGWNIWADPNKPSGITQLHERFGWNVHKAKKDVHDGINFINMNYKLIITRESTNAKKEFGQYQFKTDRNGDTLEEPVKFNDHSPDASRYAIYNELSPRFN